MLSSELENEIINDVKQFAESVKTYTFNMFENIKNALYTPVVEQPFFYIHTCSISAADNQELLHNENAAVYLINEVAHITAAENTNYNPRYIHHSTVKCNERCMHICISSDEQAMTKIHNSGHLLTKIIDQLAKIQLQQVVNNLPKSMQDTANVCQRGHCVVLIN